MPSFSMAESSIILAELDKNFTQEIKSPIDSKCDVGLDG